MHSLIDYVAFVPNVLSDEKCDTVIEWYNNNLDIEFKSLVANGVESKSRTSFSIEVPEKSEIDSILSESINKTLLAYIQSISNYPLKDDWSWVSILPKKMQSEFFIINKYEVGQEFTWHTDQGYDLKLPQTFSRQFSIVVYLNDDFDGGETEFQFAKFKPQKGSCLIFPSNFMYSHCARPVKNGVKYSVASWLAPLIEEDV